MTASGLAIIIIGADVITDIGTADDVLLGPLFYSFEQGLQMIS